jgi:hypothetical protein
MSTTPLYTRGRSLYYLIGAALALIGFGISYAAGARFWIALVIGFAASLLQPLVGQLLMPEVAAAERERARRSRGFKSIFHDRGSGDWKRTRTGRPA